MGWGWRTLYTGPNLPGGVENTVYRPQPAWRGGEHCIQAPTCLWGGGGEHYIQAPTCLEGWRTLYTGPNLPGGGVGVKNTVYKPQPAWGVGGVGGWRMLYTIMYTGSWQINAQPVTPEHKGVFENGYMGTTS